jgi:hypothetical protein
MTALPHSTRRKLSLLQLAEELGNVSKAAQLMGFHRDSSSPLRPYRVCALKRSRYDDAFCDLAIPGAGTRARSVDAFRCPSGAMA